MKPVKLLSGRQCNRKSVKSPSACIYFNRRCVHAGTGLAGWTVAGPPGVTSIVDRTANRQAAVDGDRSSDRRSDSIRRLTPAVVRASIMGFGFPFFRRRQQRYALDGKSGVPETDYCYSVVRGDQSLPTSHHSRSFCALPAYRAVNLFITPSGINCCDRRMHANLARFQLQFRRTVYVRYVYRWVSIYTEVSLCAISSTTSRLCNVTGYSLLTLNDTHDFNWCN